MGEWPGPTPGARVDSSGTFPPLRPPTIIRRVRFSLTARTIIKPGDCPESPMRSEAHVHEHFASLEIQQHAARLGMWAFLGTEILLFGGLFVGYAEYRSLYHEAFVLGAKHLDAVMATLETVVLISGSFAVALAHRSCKLDHPRLACLGLLVGAATGIAFLGLHGVEYLTHFREGALPGKYYTFHELSAPGVSMFFTLYFLLTGLHSLHVIVGTGLLIWLAWRGAAGRRCRSTFVSRVCVGG